SDLVADVRASTPTQAIEIAIPVKSEIENRLSEKEARLKSSINRIISKNRDELLKIENSYSIKNFSKLIEEKNRILILKEDKIKESLKRNLKIKNHELEIRIQKIIGLNPLGTLKRGYSITKKNTFVIKNSSEVKVGDKLETTLEFGKIISEVKEIF
ncbi:MAG: exodeoxyribonuclease VII large subunit, partial [Cetobacterium sp.]